MKFTMIVTITSLAPKRALSTPGTDATLAPPIAAPARHNGTASTAGVPSPKACPTAASLDSQSVKSANHGGDVGYDAAKRIKGRKRHLLVDTLGLVLGVAVTAASVTERAGAQVVLGRVLTWFTWLRILWVDGGYTGQS